MEDKIGKFIVDGNEAGNFAPHVKVWSEMAVRVIVMQALKKAAQQSVEQTFCKVCGASIVPNSNICVVCGN